MVNISERADALEQKMSAELDKIVVKSVIFTSGEQDPTVPRRSITGSTDGRTYLMGPDPRLRPMPAEPTLMDFFRCRFSPATHLLQSATIALKNGYEEKVVFACLLHDIATVGLIRSDHGYWGSQLIEPYVEPEISWAIRAHQVLRFFPDPSVGYEYPKMYISLFGSEFKPEPYVERYYQEYRQHKWYMTGRLITINDLYAFDPNMRVNLEDFTDVIGRNFKQPKEGLGFDASPSAHMWRTINMPTRFI